MDQDIDRVLVHERRIRDRVAELGARISRDYEGKDVTVVALLKGGVVFLSDLIRSISVPMHLDFAWASSYGDGTTSSGNVALRVMPDTSLRGRHVLLVDDILDTGRTLARVSAELRDRFGAAEVKTCVLLDKAARREVDVRADYVGFEVENVFVVGYGLDFADRYRNLPYIGVLKPHLYAN